MHESSHFLSSALLSIDTVFVCCAYAANASEIL